MDQQPTPDLDQVATDPDDLDGHTIEDLADYLDAGRYPPDPTIDSSPACQHALAALERLRRLTADDLATDRRTPAEDEAWIDRVMSQIALDARAGADVHLPGSSPDTDLVMTEGALRALIRAAGDEQPGFLIGRIRFHGDLTDRLHPATIDVHTTVLYGIPIPDAVEELRTRIADELHRHLQLTTARIDITVQDVDYQPEDDAA